VAIAGVYFVHVVLVIAFIYNIYNINNTTRVNNAALKQGHEGLRSSSKSDLVVRSVETWR